MSTAKVDSPATVPQSEEAPALTAADFAAILSSTLAMAAEAGLAVGVRNRPADGSRPAGLLVFIEGLNATADGRLIPPAPDVLAPKGIEGNPNGAGNTAIVPGKDA